MAVLQRSVPSATVHPSAVRGRGTYRRPGGGAQIRVSRPAADFYGLDATSYNLCSLLHRLSNDGLAVANYMGCVPLSSGGSSSDTDAYRLGCHYTCNSILLLHSLPSQTGVPQLPTAHEGMRANISYIEIKLTWPSSALCCSASA